MATLERVAVECRFGRPSWPPEAIAAAGLPPDADVVDLGAGMGPKTVRPENGCTGRA